MVKHKYRKGSRNIPFGTRWSHNMIYKIKKRSEERMKLKIIEDNLRDYPVTYKGGIYAYLRYLYRRVFK